MHTSPVVNGRTDPLERLDVTSSNQFKVQMTLLRIRFLLFTNFQPQKISEEALLLNSALKTLSRRDSPLVTTCLQKMNSILFEKCIYLTPFFICQLNKFYKFVWSRDSCQDLVNNRNYSVVVKQATVNKSPTPISQGLSEVWQYFNGDARRCSSLSVVTEASRNPLIFAFSSCLIIKQPTCK